MARVQEVISRAEGIKSHEVSTRQAIEKIEQTIASIDQRIAGLRAAMADAYSELMAAQEDTDDDGYPNYSRIASAQARLSGISSSLESANDEKEDATEELKDKIAELSEVLEEKSETVFEIQEKARMTSQNINFAAGMYGDFAGVGSALQSQLQSVFSGYEQAAQILDSSVNMASGGGSSPTGGGHSSTSSSRGGGTSNKAGSLSGFRGGHSSIGGGSHYSTSQSGRMTAGSTGNFSKGGSSSSKGSPSYRTNQTSNHETSHAFNGVSSSNTSSSSLGDTSKYSTSQSSSNASSRGGINNFSAKVSGSFSGSSVTIKTNPQDALRNYMNAHNYSKEDYEVYSQDSTWQKLHAAAYPQSHSSGSSIAKAQLSSYMSSHNYGIGDFPTYSGDPKWQQLHKQAYPDSKLIGTLVGSSIAFQNLQNYMNAHNYGRGDYPIYSKDPTWQSLHALAYPVSTNQIIYKGNPDRASMHAKLGDKAKALFSDMFGSQETKEPVNQILSTFHPVVNQILQQEPTLSDLYYQVENVAVNKLNEDQKDLIVDLSIRTLQKKFGKRFTPDMGERIKNNISFESNDDKYNCGYYDTIEDKLHINMNGNATTTDIIATVLHEGNHLISTHEHETGHTGVTKTCGTGMNEGITELLAIKDMKELTSDYKSEAYQELVKPMQDIMEIVGEDLMRDCYINNDMSRIAYNFNSFLGDQKAFEKLADDMHEIYYFTYVVKDQEIANEYIKNVDIAIEKFKKAHRGSSKGNKYKEMHISPRNAETNRPVLRKTKTSEPTVHYLSDDRKSFFDSLHVNIDYSNIKMNQEIKKNTGEFKEPRERSIYEEHIMERRIIPKKEKSEQVIKKNTGGFTPDTTHYLSDEGKAFHDRIHFEIDFSNIHSNTEIKKNSGGFKEPKERSLPEEPIVRRIRPKKVEEPDKKKRNTGGFTPDTTHYLSDEGNAFHDHIRVDVDFSNIHSHTEIKKNSGDPYKEEREKALGGER